MAEVTIRCTHCRGEVVIEEEWTGMEIECPRCGKDFIAQTESAAVEEDDQFEIRLSIPAAQSAQRNRSVSTPPPIPSVPRTPAVPAPPSVPRIPAVSAPPPAPAVSASGVPRAILRTPADQVAARTIQKNAVAPRPPVAPAAPGGLRPVNTPGMPGTPAVPHNPYGGASATAGGRSAHRSQMDELHAANDARMKKRHTIKLIFLLILLVVGVTGAVWGVIKLVTPTPESLVGNQLYAMTPKRINRDGAFGMMEIARQDFFPHTSQKENFFYRKALFTYIDLKAIGSEEYEGTITFIRNNKNMTRPVYIDRRGSFTHYRFPFKYKDHPEYLEEDADLIFELAGQLDEDLKKYTFKSARVTEDYLLVVTAEYGGDEKDFSMKVEQVDCDDKVGRVWIEFVD